MKYYPLKDQKHFHLYGSTVLDEPGFCRLSSKEREIIQPINPDVSFLATHSAGIQAKFSSDATTIQVHVKNQDKANMNHMPATGQCGVDLYVFDEQAKKFVFHDVTRFDLSLSEYEINLCHFTTPKMRRYLFNLPLYMGAVEFEVGFNDEAKVVADTFSHDGRIAVYGTSITQGGCVSRPGMLYTNLLSRWLDQEFLNFGFSGAALGEKEIAQFIGNREKQDLLIIDIEANAGCDERLEQNLPTFLSTYHELQPNVPIILVSRIPFAMDLFDEARKNLKRKYHSYLKKIVKEQQEQGYAITYLDGTKFFQGDFTEYTVDGIHPTDLGSMAIAKAYLKAINKVREG